MKAIITFHSIDNSGSVLSYPPKDFSELLESLARSNLPVINLTDLLDNKIKKGIAITFDDGMRSVFTEALPVLKDYNVPAHLYLTTGVVGRDNKWPTQPEHAPVYDMLSWDELEKLQAAGVYIESHTNTHPDMRALSLPEIEDECNIADDLIEKRFARRPEYFAYPYGFKNNNVCDFARNRYKGTVTTEFRTINIHEDFAKLPRLDAYYLQPKWLITNLDGSFSKAYLALRGWLRTIRGTQ